MHFWCISYHVFPIPKKGDKSNPLNFRPIVITSLISQTMEAIITKQLLTFLETNNRCDHQYSFRKARSTGELLACAFHVLSSALESYGESRVVASGTRVFSLNYRCWSPYTLIKWIGSFLSDRSIVVIVDGVLSNLHSIHAGVPQGSVISPVLFFLFIIDLPTSTSSSIHSFANDTFLHFHSIKLLILVGNHISILLLNMHPKCSVSPPEPVSFSHLLTSNYIQVPNPSFFRVLLPRVAWHSNIYSLSSLDKVQSLAIRLINNPNLAKYLQPLSHYCLIRDLSIFYRYFHRHCSQEIRDIIPVPLRRVRTTRSSTHSHPSKFHYLLHELYPTNHHSSEEHFLKSGKLPFLLIYLVI